MYVEPQDAHSRVVANTPYAEWPQIAYRRGDFPRTVKDAEELRRAEAEGYSLEHPDGFSLDGSGRLVSHVDLKAQELQDLHGLTKRDAQRDAAAILNYDQKARAAKK